MPQCYKEETEVKNPSDITRAGFTGTWLVAPWEPTCKEPALVLCFPLTVLGVLHSCVFESVCSKWSWMGERDHKACAPAEQTCTARVSHVWPPTLAASSTYSSHDAPGARTPGRPLCTAVQQDSEWHVTSVTKWGTPELREAKLPVRTRACSQSGKKRDRPRARIMSFLISLGVPQPARCHMAGKWQSRDVSQVDLTSRWLWQHLLQPPSKGRRVGVVSENVCHDSSVSDLDIWPLCVYPLWLFSLFSYFLCIIEAAFSPFTEQIITLTQEHTTMSPNGESAKRLLSETRMAEAFLKILLKTKNWWVSCNFKVFLLLFPNTSLPGQGAVFHGRWNLSKDEGRAGGEGGGAGWAHADRQTFTPPQRGLVRVNTNVGAKQRVSILCAWAPQRLKVWEFPPHDLCDRKTPPPTM